MNFASALSSTGPCLCLCSWFFDASDYLIHLTLELVNINTSKTKLLFVKLCTELLMPQTNQKRKHLRAKQRYSYGMYILM